VSRERFLAIASHELKTPLTAIYGLAQLQERMLRQAPLPTEPEALRTEQERQWSFSKRMVRQLERMTELIEGLLDLSRIRAGRFSVEPIPVDAARAVRELQDQRLSILANEAGVELLVELPERLPAKLDPLRFDEVVTNLVMQGIRRSPEGGLVRLELAPVNHTLRLRVSDQGVPIPRSEWDSSFEPFMSREGLGLGLYVSRQIARLHQGEVRFLEPEGPRGNRLEATFSNPISQAA
jgi:signal transduction histidine kinase